MDLTEIKTVLIADKESESGQAAVKVFSEKRWTLLFLPKEEGGEPCLSMSRKEIRAAIKDEMEKAGSARLDAVYYNRQPEVFRKTVEDLSGEEIDRMVKIDISAAFFFMQAVGDILSEQRQGSVVFLNSIHADKPTGITPLYCMYMGALKNMVREAAVYYGTFNVRVNSIERGASEDSEALFHNDTSSFYDGCVYKIPCGHMETWEEISRIAAFLLSEDSACVNGAELRADNGLLLHYLDVLANERAWRNRESVK